LTIKRLPDDALLQFSLARKSRDPDGRTGRFVRGKKLSGS
jgi:hypothetical protein